MADGDVIVIPPEQVGGAKKQKMSRTVAIDTIFEVFGHPANRADFKRCLSEKAAEDILQFYKEYVFPLQPKEARLEIDGGLNFNEVKMLLGEAVVKSAVMTKEDVEMIEKLDEALPPLEGDEEYDDTEMDDLELKVKKSFIKNGD